VAAALQIGDDGVVVDARVVLGGVAHKPWRALAAENALRGQPLTDATMAQAGASAVAGAQPHAHNAFKVELARRAVERALRIAGGAA
jgi:xanthine dehydrogenase YagS FAD-binding subunit